MSAISTEVDLEVLLSRPESPRCESVVEHPCADYARWQVLVSDVKCAGTRGRRRSGSLWCDGRYKQWLDRRNDYRCLCGLPQTHWQVIAL